MKVVLSRKGFDSANGGIVSPILEDGSMISFPIPSKNDSDTYDDLANGGDLYTQLLQDLRYKGMENHCHVDPDLDPGRRVYAIDGWRPAFGQIDSSATYLKNIGIGPGDLFLFFGNFHQVSRGEKGLRYVRKSGDFYKDHDLQVIWGYLQVEDVITDPVEQSELFWHPHAKPFRTGNKTNVIFTGRKAGLLPFDVKRVLTLEGANKATWKMNEVYDPDHILCKRKNQAKNPSEGIYYAGIWQELGLVESHECEEWAWNMIR